MRLIVLVFVVTTYLLPFGCLAADAASIKLSRLVLQADRVEVYDTLLELKRPMIYSSTNRRDIEELNKALDVEWAKDGLACACEGSITVILYRGRKELVSMSILNAYGMRTSMKHASFAFNDYEKWLRWFDDRNMPSLRTKYERDLADEKQRQKDFERWKAAIPPQIRPLWDTIPKDYYYPDKELLNKALQKELPDLKQRALALFQWYGSGAGPWTGSPVYEGGVEAFLTSIPVQVLVDAAMSDPLSDAQLEGAARFFSGDEFSRQQKKEAGFLPVQLKEKLLAYVLKSTNKDKLYAGKKAFAPAK